MATVYPDYDGVVFKYATDSWTNVRAASIGSLNTVSSAYLYNFHTAGRGADTFQIGRYFLEFDTSAITDTLSSATLKIKGASGVTNLDVMLVKGSQSGSVVAGDFNQISGGGTALLNSDGSGAGTFAGTPVVEYSSELTTWSSSGYNDISLNATALTDIKDNSTFHCVLIGYDYDYLDQDLSGGATYGIRLRQDSSVGTSSDPYIDYTVETAYVVDNAIFFGTNF